jgi:hypothetical protein
LIKLFDKTSDIIAGPSDNNEKSFNYYHKSNRKDILIIRETIENWFLSYPASEKIELKNRFKKDMDSAFYELFLYEMFKKLGFLITIHPELENSNKKPDFLIEKDGIQCYVEAKVCYDKSQEEMAFDRRKNQFFDNLSKVKIKGFLLRIAELEFKTNKQPSVKELIPKIEERVENLDPRILTLEMEKLGFDGCPNIDFENQDFKITIQPIPLIESKRNKISKNPIGMFPIETFWGGGKEALRDSILKKAKRYGKFKIPYLICVNALGHKTTDKIDVENAVWGSLKYTFSDYKNIENGTMSRESDGIFFNSGKKKLTNVSGVFVSKVFPSNVPNAKYWIYENPFADNKLNFEKINLIYNYIDGKERIGVTGENLDEVFDISKQWLDG